MPERVWVTPETEAETYKVFKAWPAGGVPYVPESRLREVEAERAKDREEYEGREAHFLKQQADVQDALRADLAALMPLARAGLAAYDYAMAKQEYGGAEIPVLDHVSILETLAAARAVLAREAGK